MDTKAARGGNLKRSFAGHRPGIRDLADAVGLSISTVSRALNGYDDVNDLTRRRVEDAAREIGYSANYAATSLRSSRTSIITYLASRPWTKFVDPLHLSLLEGLEMVLQARGYDLHVVMARGFDNELQILKRLVEQGRCDGVLLGRTKPHDERIDYLVDGGFPFVSLGRTRRDDHDWIDRDHYAIGRDATRRLLDLGHERIAVLSTPRRFAFSNAAIRGYRAALRQAGAPHDPSLERESSQTFSGEMVLAEMLAEGQRPTALVCGNDAIAMSAMDGMRRQGLRPGRDIAVIGCDDTPIAAYYDPPLTTFAQDIDKAGARMARMLISRLEGRKKRQTATIKSNLVERATDCPPPRSRGKARTRKARRH